MCIKSKYKVQNCIKWSVYSILLSVNYTDNGGKTFHKFSPIGGESSRKAIPAGKWEHYPGMDKIYQHQVQLYKYDLADFQFQEFVDFFDFCFGSTLGGIYLPRVHYRRQVASVILMEEHLYLCREYIVTCHTPPS